MGLSSTLSSALAGMNGSQRGIDVLSRNVANAGTPGYHRQSLVLTESNAGQSSYVRASEVERAFNEALQKQYGASVSSNGYHSVRAEFMDRLQLQLGKPGDPTSLDTLYTEFENSLQGLATNPNDPPTRAAVIDAARSMAGRLNGLSNAVQEMRGEAESQIANAVNTVNRQLSSLTDLNDRILDISQDQSARLALMDERDRLVSSISEMVDVKVNYRANGSVALMTNSGVGLLDKEPSQFKFETGGMNSPLEDPEGLTLVTPSGAEFDMSGLLKSGRIVGLFELRDTDLATAQSQLDEIAAGLAQAMNTVTTPSTDITGGRSLDTTTLETNGDSALVSYSSGGEAHRVRLVQVETPGDFSPPQKNAAGEWVVGYAAGADADATAANMRTALNDAVTAGDVPAGISASGTGAGLDVTATAPAEVTGLVGKSASDALQGNGNAPALNLFVDTNDTTFTDSLDGQGQKTGFAARIGVNSEVIANTGYLVQFEGDTSMGDATRPETLLENLKTSTFVAGEAANGGRPGVRLSGSVSDLVGQTLNFQGNAVSEAQSLSESQALTLESINTRVDAEYGVNIDEEMARLIELQNAYSASARVVSTVQELIDALLAM